MPHGVPPVDRAITAVQAPLEALFPCSGPRHGIGSYVCEELDQRQGELEKFLATGKDLNFSKAELKKMGYQITSTNDKEKNHVDIEIVKGQDSCEVQIDLTSNMWQSDATDEALAARKK